MPDRSNLATLPFPGHHSPADRILKLRDLVIEHGVEAARRMATTKADRTVIDAAATVQPDIDHDIAYGSLVFTTLPHKGGAHLMRWEHVRAEGTYVWRGGLFDGKAMGVPYGAKGRMMLIYFLTEAVRTGSLAVTVGSSMYEWARTIATGAVGGATYKLVLAHSQRIAVSHVTLREHCGGGSARPIGSLDDTLIMSSRGTNRGERISDVPQSALDAPDFAVLNAGFYQICQKYLVPVRVSALREISNNSAAINLYFRLGWHLPRLKGPRIVPWSELMSQFGSGYKHEQHMKPAFLDTLRLVLAIYREAQVELAPNGLMIHPSRPPIDLRQGCSQDFC